jgi:hypothetical protein
MDPQSLGSNPTASKSSDPDLNSFDPMSSNFDRRLMIDIIIFSIYNVSQEFDCVPHFITPITFCFLEKDGTI